MWRFILNGLDTTLHAITGTFNQTVTGNLHLHESAEAPNVWTAQGKVTLIRNIFLSEGGRASNATGYFTYESVSHVIGHSVVGVLFPIFLILRIVACRMPSGFCHMLLWCHATAEMAYVQCCVAAGQSGLGGGGLQDGSFVCVCLAGG